MEHQRIAVGEGQMEQLSLVLPVEVLRGLAYRPEAGEVVVEDDERRLPDLVRATLGDGNLHRDAKLKRDLLSVAAARQVAYVDAFDKTGAADPLRAMGYVLDDVLGMLKRMAQENRIVPTKELVAVLDKRDTVKQEHPR